MTGQALGGSRKGNVLINTALRLGSAVLVLCCAIVRLHAGESPRQRLCEDAYAIITDEAEDPRLKTKLVELLALLPAADSAGTLGKLLHSKGVDQQTVMYALSTLTRHGTDGALDQLMAALGNAETSPETKQQIVTSCYRRSLARRKDTPVLQAVVKEGPAGARLPAAILVARTGVRGQESGISGRPTATGQRQTADGKNIGGKKIMGRKIDAPLWSTPLRRRRQPCR